MRGLYRDTVTLYNVTGEVDNKATYRRTVLHGVGVEEYSGALASLSGKSSTDGIALYIPGSIAGYVQPLAFDGSAGWTLRDGDLLAIGEQTSELPPPSLQQLSTSTRTYRVKGVETFMLDDTRVHHWEVAGA